MRPNPDDRVVVWIDSQNTASLFTTTITQAEILYGVSLLPSGSRKCDLLAVAQAMFQSDFKNRVLPFDGDAAMMFGTLSADRSRLGRPISQFDALVAAITVSRGATLATHNTRDFEACGVRLIDPWEVG